MTALATEDVARVIRTACGSTAFACGGMCYRKGACAMTDYFHPDNTLDEVANQANKDTALALRRQQLDETGSSDINLGLMEEQRKKPENQEFLQNQGVQETLTDPVLRMRFLRHETGVPLFKRGTRNGRGKTEPVKTLEAERARVHMLTRRVPRYPDVKRR